MEAMAALMDRPPTIPNHTIDPNTGFLESNAYASAFDAHRKEEFLRVYKANSLGLYRTCQQLGISHHTIHLHCKIDPAFKEAMRQVETEWGNDLESRSRSVAMTRDSATLERMFHLRALFPDKYARELKGNGDSQVNFHINGDVLVSLKKKTETLDTTIVQEVESANNPQSLSTTTQSTQPLTLPTETRSSSELRGPEREA